MPSYFFTAILFTLCLRCVWRFATLPAGRQIHGALYVAAAVMFAMNGLALASVGA